MMRPIVISLSPNTESDDVALARQVLHDTASWQDESIIASVRQRLESLFDGKPVTMASSGRQALYLLLQALGIGQGDEVIIQAFACIAVPATIRWAGAKPVYADIKRETFNLDPASMRQKITPRTRAIVVQHTFGIPGPLAELQAIAQENKLLLLEDCAHALGVTHEGRMLGRFGDAAFLSFGRDKMISSVFGGAIINPTSVALGDLRGASLDQLPLPPAWWVRQQLRHPIFFQAMLPWYFKAGLGKISLVVAQQLGMISKAVAAAEKLGDKPDHLAWGFSAALGQLLQLQLDKLRRYTARRQEIAQRYQQEFGGPLGLLRYPLLREDAAQIIKTARTKNMLLGDWYNTPLAPADADPELFGYQAGSCPVAEEVARRVINLPTYPTMTNQQVEQVIDFVKSYGNSGDN